VQQQLHKQPQAGGAKRGGGETKLSVLQQSVGSRLSLDYLHYLPAVHTRFVSFSMHLPTHADPRSSNHIARNAYSLFHASAPTCSMRAKVIEWPHTGVRGKERRESKKR